MGRTLTCQFLAWGSLLVSAQSAAAPPWVELEVAAEIGGPAGSMQEWARLLSDLGVDQVRIRGANRADQPRLETHGAGDAVRYAVLGVLTRRDVLMLPGGRFSQSDRGKLQEYFRTLGDQAASGLERGRFDLTAGEFEALHALLTPQLIASTKGQTCGAVIEQISPLLGVPLQIDDSDQALLARSGPLETELKSFSLGMALACALRPAERALAVVRPAAGATRPTLRVVPLDGKRDTWPVGWRPTQVSKQIAPQMFRITTIEIKGYTLAQTLVAMAPHMGVPMVVDQRTLTSLEIEPETIRVNVPRKKTYVKKAVDQALSQSRLGGELRVDEVGRPFYWITQFGKLSRRAE